MAIAKDEDHSQGPNHARREQVRWWVNLLENQFEILGYRFGWDAILALVPAGGNLVSLLPAAWIIGLSYQMGAPLSVLLRMCLRLGCEWLLGLLPLIGVVGDILYKANSRNAAALDRWLVSPHHESRESRWYVAAVLGAVMGTGFALCALVVWVIWTLIAGLSTGI